MEETTLPFFRLIGLHCRTSPKTAPADTAALWPHWHDSGADGRIKAFSRTVYCAYHDYEDSIGGAHGVTLGKLVTVSTEVPEGLDELWVPPQRYALYRSEQTGQQAAAAIWQQIHASSDSLQRAGKVDFEAYPNSGGTLVYVGIETGSIEHT